jgi:IS30 family transposase
MRRRWRRMPPEVRREVIRLAGRGVTQGEICRQIDISAGAVNGVLKPLGGVIRGEMLEVRDSRHLCVDDRVEILVGLETGLSMHAIADGLGRAASTVCREVNRNGGRDRYRPLDAQRAAWDRARRPKATKLAANAVLCDRVSAELVRLWSPQQIAAGLAADFGDDHSMRVSHETIYKSLYVQGRGELRRELTACLRSGRARRKPRGRLETRGRITDMVMISERPAEVADRAVPGHWEGDLIIGKDGKSAIGTLVERTSRFVMLLHLVGDHRAETVREAMTAKILTLPVQLRRSVTWDQGREMAEHLQFTIDTKVALYFCDPHSPWQRGSNENTNGLLRQYFPKGSDLSVHDEAHLDTVAESLNTRPRQTLGWMTPSKRLAELVATTG